MNVKPVKVTIFENCADASLIFPLLVGETFARHYYSTREKIVLDI